MKAYIEVICPYCEKQIALKDIVNALLQAASPPPKKTVVKK